MGESFNRGMDALETPERVDLHVDLAGAGSRSMAFVVDYLLVVIAMMFAGLVSLAGAAAAGELGMVIWIVSSFGIFWAYFFAFEVAWNGQTPGKRLLGLRVQKVGGYPIRWTDALIRNLLRPLVDLMAFVLPIGLVVMIFSRRHQRIGDLAAGTVVVREQKAGLADFGTLGYEGGQGDLLLSLEEFELVRGFLARRRELHIDSRTRIGRELAQALRQSLTRQNQLTGDIAELEGEPFLERVYDLYRGALAPQA